MATTNKNFKVKNGLDVNGPIGVGSDPDYGTTGQILVSAGSGSAPTWEDASAGGGGISNVVEDTTPQLGGDLDTNGYDITNLNALTIDTTPTGVPTSQGTISWSEDDGTLNVQLESDVVLQVGQEIHTRIHNSTGNTISNGEVVYINAGSDIHGHVSVAPFIADGSIESTKVIGLATHNILDGEDGYVTGRGLVRGVNTAAYSVGDVLYGDPTTPGAFTNDAPDSPNTQVILGVVTVSDASGTVYVQLHNPQISSQVSYDNAASGLISTNVKGAIDELQATKASLDSLSSNIQLLPTSTESDVSGYYRMVLDINDADYDETAVDISTGDLDGTGDAHLIASLIADADIFSGDAGLVNITTIGNIAKISGNSNSYSEFFFRVYLRHVDTSETLIAQSSTTGAINPVTSDYSQFSASAGSVLNGVLATDRLVIKYYSNIVDDGNQEYQFQFGGNQPIRTLIPVPASVIQVTSADGIFTNTAPFTGVLSSADTTVQAALETIDGIVQIPDQTGNEGKLITTTGSTIQWNSISSLGIAELSGATFTGDVTANSLSSNTGITVIGPAIVGFETNSIPLVVIGKLADASSPQISFLSSGLATTNDYDVSISATGGQESVNGQGTLEIDAADVDISGNVNAATVNATTFIGNTNAATITGTVANGTTTTAASGVGYMGMPQITNPSSTYSIQVEDAGKHIYMTSTGRTINFGNTANTLPTGATIVIINGGSATTSITATTGTLRMAGTGATGDRTLAPDGMATLVKVVSGASPIWIISGNGLS